MEDFYPVVKVAAVQAAPEYLDRDATVEKACSLIDKAGSEGAKLVAFPEAFIPGYPWWIWFDEPAAGIPFFIKLYKNAVTVPGPAVQSLSEAAKRNGVYVCISVTEKDGASLYLTQLWFNPNGDLIGKHRKLKPSGAERYIWGEGDASMMPVFDTEIGRLGGLECWEHMVPANMMAMMKKNEQIHVQAWAVLLPAGRAPVLELSAGDGRKSLFHHQSGLFSRGIPDLHGTDAGYAVHYGKSSGRSCIRDMG